MKALRHLPLWAVLLALAGCVLEGGNGSETTNHLAGTVERGDGSPAVHVIVRAVPIGHNPLQDTLAPDLIDTTDWRGCFRIRHAAPGGYQLEFQDPGGGARAWKGGVAYRGGSLDVGSIRLAEPGSLRILLSEGMRTGGGFVFVPGSTYRADVSEAFQTFLDSLPEMRIPTLAFAHSIHEIPTIIARDIDIYSGKGTDISIPDTLPLPHEALFQLRTTPDGADISGDVAGFPLLLRLDSANFDFRISRADRAGIAFHRANNISLPYEVERWDSLGRKAEIWIRMDRIQGNSNSEFILMHWGTEAGTAAIGTAIFDSSDGFAGVWHLSSGTCGCKNSANAAKGATPINFDGNERIEGPIGLADTLEPGRDTSGGFKNDIIDLGDPGIEKSVTLSAWVRLGTLKGGDSDANEFMKVPMTGLATRFGLYTGSDTIPPFIRVLDDQLTYGGKSVGLPYGTNPIPLGAWTLLTGTFDGQVLRTFVNGMLDHSETVSFPENLLTDVQHAYFGFAYGGSADEIRVERVARSEAWIKLSYQNQKTGQTLVKRVR
jgi:hypothetical protein